MLNRGSFKQIYWQLKTNDAILVTGFVFEVF